MGNSNWRPLHVPGKRFVLTKNMILESQKHTKSNMEAARWLGVSYNTYKKWAKYYDVFEQHLNPKGFGVKKGWAVYKIPIEDIISGKRDMPSMYNINTLKKRMVEEGYLVEECTVCNWNESRVTDGQIPLRIDFIDGNSGNKSMENMRLLCPNCFYVHNGFFYSSKRFGK